MSIKIGCDKCSAKLSLKDLYAGRKIHCPRCSHVIQVPAAEEDPFADLNFQEEHEIGSQDSPDEGDPDDQLMPLPKLPKRKPKTSAPPAKGPSTEKSSRDGTKGQQTNAKLPSSPANLKWIFMGGGGAAIFLISIGVGYLLSSGSKPEPLIEADQTVAVEKNIATEPEQAPARTPEHTLVRKLEQPDENVVNKKSATKAPALSVSNKQKTLRDELAKMQKLIAAEDDREFFIHYAPIDELRKFQKAEAEGQSPPVVPRDSLKVAIAMVVEKPAEIDDSGLVAVFRAEGSRVVDPDWAVGPGYPGEIQEVIARAIAEIEHGDIKQFIKNMFPPDVLLVMFRNGPDHSTAPLMNQGSAMVVRMLEDLKKLQSLKPKIKADVAEFVLEAVVYEQNQRFAVRPFEEGRYPIPDRLIRFSMINKRWRFYDDGTLRKTGLLEDKGVQLRFERLGTSWRLAKYP